MFYPLQCSGLYSPWNPKEPDLIERLSLSLFTYAFQNLLCKGVQRLHWIAKRIRGSNISCSRVCKSIRANSFPPSFKVKVLFLLPPPCSLAFFLPVFGALDCPGSCSEARGEPRGYMQSSLGPESGGAPRDGNTGETCSYLIPPFHIQSQHTPELCGQSSG